MADGIQLSGAAALIGTFFGMRQMAKKKEAMDAELAAATDLEAKMEVMAKHDPELYKNTAFLTQLQYVKDAKAKQAADVAANRAAQVQSEKRRLFEEMNVAGGNFVDPMARAENVAIYGPLAGIDKDQMQAATKALEQQRDFGYDTQKETQQQTGRTLLEGVQQGNRVALEGIQQENKLAAQRQQAGLQGGLAIQKANLDRMTEKYKMDLEAGRPAKPPVGFELVQDGMAPVPGTTEHTKASTYINETGNTYRDMVKYRGMADRGIAAFGGNARKADAEREKIINAYAKVIAGANPSNDRATMEQDYARAKELVPSVSSIFGRDKAALEQLDAVIADIEQRGNDAQAITKNWRGMPRHSFSRQVQAKPRP